MKLALLLATATIALASGAYAQDTLTGTNTANSGSSSQSGSNATGIGINGSQQTTDVTSGSQSGAVSGSNSASKSTGNNTTVNTASTQNQSQGQTNGQTNTQTTGATNTNIFQGTTIPRQTTATIYSAPQIVAPALSTTLTETCMGSGSAGISTPWGGLTGGKTYEDKQCIRRLNSRELAAQGFRVEACYVMMGDPEVAAAFAKSGRSCDLAAAHPETSYPNIAQPPAPPPPPPPPPAEAPPAPAPYSQEGTTPLPEKEPRGVVAQPEHQAVIAVPDAQPKGTMAPIPNPPN